MALTAKQLQSLNNLHALPVAQIICIAKAAVKAYKCVKAAGNDPEKILQCAETLVKDIEACLKK